jgi:CBS domain-containing protein
MTEPAVCCAPDLNLAAAAELMWNHDCGVLPVVEDGRLAGIITDRDICIAVGTRNRPAAELTVGDVATREVETCAPDSDIHAAMTILRRAKVRRLPVVNEQGNLEGLVGLNDIILTVGRKHSQVTYEEVLNTVKAVSEHRAHKPAAKAGTTTAAAVA